MDILTVIGSMGSLVLVTLIGYVAARAGFLTSEVRPKLSALIFNVTLPCTILASVGEVDSSAGTEQVTWSFVLGTALFFVMMVTKAMDTGGYIFGMLSNRWMPGGNHKIVPSISPKKSWEGTAGGVILSIAVSLLFYWLFCSKGIGVNAPLGWDIAAAVVLALGSFAGDLTESALKRTCDVKDSGHWIPGMGGAFDVLDSFIYNGILFWLLVFFLR